MQTLAIILFCLHFYDRRTVPVFYLQLVCRRQTKDLEGTLRRSGNFLTRVFDSIVFFVQLLVVHTAPYGSRQKFMQCFPADSYFIVVVLKEEYKRICNKAKSAVKVEVAVLGPPSLIVLTVYVDVKQNLKKKKRIL